MKDEKKIILCYLHENESPSYQVCASEEEAAGEIEFGWFRVDAIPESAVVLR